MSLLRGHIYNSGERMKDRFHLSMAIACFLAATAFFIIGLNNISTFLGMIFADVMMGLFVILGLSKLGEFIINNDPRSVGDKTQ